MGEERGENGGKLRELRFFLFLTSLFPHTQTHYLVRLAPFTAAHIDLHGGRFDVPDRLFASVEATWRGVLTGPSDVKELMPEWYGGAPPDWLLNAASLPLGTRQDGSPVGDVVLPPWATGDTPRARAAEFLRVQRAALESDVVSAALPAWIDLIFGAKQRGKAAIAASNVFFWLTYEDAVNVGELDKEAVALVDEQVSERD